MLGELSDFVQDKSTITQEEKGLFGQPVKHNVRSLEEPIQENPKSIDASTGYLFDNIQGQTQSHLFYK